MKTIALIAIQDNNLGDAVICDTTKYIIEKIASDFKIKVVSIFPKNGFSSRIKITNTLNVPNWKQRFKHLRFKLYLHVNKNNIKSYYDENLKDVSCVVFVGGGLIKYTTQSFFYPVYAITKYCKKHNIPVYFNAVGVEGYDKNNASSKFLEKALNEDCIKFITTRDDMESLEKYIKDKSKISLVGDSALYSKETYGNLNEKQSDVIGVGVIRGKIFTDYCMDYSEERLKEAYVNVIKELENRNYKWQMFANGTFSDYDFALSVLEKLNIKDTEKYLKPRPSAPKEFVKIITGYKAIIAARLHANIIAASYSIPSIGFVWNNKLKLFGQMIGHPERFIEHKDLDNAKLIVDRLENAIIECKNSPPPYEKIDSLKQKTREGLEKFIRSLNSE